MKSKLLPLAACLLMLALAGVSGSAAAVGALLMALLLLPIAISAKTEPQPYQTLANSAYGVEAWFNPQGKLLWINSSVERSTGYSMAECMGAADVLDLLFDTKDRSFVGEILQKALRGEASAGQEVRLRKKDGAELWVALNWQTMRDTPGLRLSISEIERRKQAELKLLDAVIEARRAQTLQLIYLRHSDEARLRLEALLNALHIGVLFLDEERRVIHCNQAFLALGGFAPDENLDGVRAEVILDTCTRLIPAAAQYRQHLEALNQAPERASNYEFTLEDGRIITEITVPVPASTPDKPSGRVWLYEDVTEQRQNAERLTQLADRDPLTNLLNRRRFHEELLRMQAEAERRRVSFGLLAIDLDGFKSINDRFGHQAGDDVLTTLARAVGHTVRKNEVFFRLGGDEFAILATDSGETEMLGLARRVIALIVAQRWQFNGQEVSITASLGIAIYPRDAKDTEELIAHADAAMYQAKNEGRNTWQVYRPPTSASNGKGQTPLFG